MNTAQSHMTWRRVASILWFPVFFAIVLPVTFEVAFHRPTPHGVPIAVVGNARQVTLMRGELHRISATGFKIQPLPSASAATAAIRERHVAAAYVADGSTTAVYLARAASFVRASYLQAGLARGASETHTPPPQIIDLVPLRSGDGGTGIFFFVLPLMMAGLITAIVLLQLPSWGIGRRVIVVAAVGAVGAAATYLTAVGLNVLPGKPLLLAYAFVLTQIYGQLMVGAAPLLKQYFLPVSLTSALILSVPSSGGTVTPDLLPAVFRELSHALPLAQGVSVARAVAYFHNTGIGQATLVLGLWAAVAAATVAVAWRRQPHARPAAAQGLPETNGAASRGSVHRPATRVTVAADLAHQPTH